MCETQHPKSEYIFVSGPLQWVNEEKSKNGTSFHYEEPPKALILLWGVS